MVIITDSQGNPVEIAGSLTVNNVVEGGGSGGTATIDPSVLNGFLPVTAGSSKPLTGGLYANEGIYLGADSSSNNTKGITLTNTNSQTAKIGLDNTGLLGIYSDGSINIRTSYSVDPNYGITINSDSILPYYNNSIALGRSNNQFNKIYGRFIYQDNKQVANKEDVDAKSTII